MRRYGITRKRIRQVADAMHFVVPFMAQCTVFFQESVWVDKTGCDHITSEPQVIC